MFGSRTTVKKVRNSLTWFSQKADHQPLTTATWWLRRSAENGCDFNCDVGPVWDLGFLANVCPRVLHCCLRKWDGVRWSGLFLGFGPLGCLYVLFYTSIVSIEMNVVVSTSIVRRFEGCFLPWVHCYFVEVQYWEDPEWPACFTRCLAVFGFAALFLNDIVIHVIRCFWFKVVHFCVVKSDVRANWAKPCLRHFIVFPFL